MSSNADTCARKLPDRRRRPTPILSRYWLRGRRRGGRRAGEATRIYVDGYATSEWRLLLALLCLSGLDLLLTLVHVAAGGAEANPVMAWALAAGGGTGFATLKILLTVPAALILLLHVRFHLARHALRLLVAAYFAVMAWHALVALDRVSP